MDSNRYFDIALITLTNFIGYWSVAVCFFTLLQLGLVSEDFFISETTISFRDWSAGILIVWLVCMLFSIAGMFLKKNERYILMISPAIIPVIYGFSVLILFGGASF